MNKIILISVVMFLIAADTYGSNYSSNNYNTYKSSNEAKMWKKCLKANTFNKYRRYLQSFPYGIYSVQALNKIKMFNMRKAKDHYTLINHKPHWLDDDNVVRIKAYKRETFEHLYDRLLKTVKFYYGNDYTKYILDINKQLYYDHYTLSVKIDRLKQLKV